MPCAMLGVDIAKHTFDVCLMTTTSQRRQHVVANTRIGFQRLGAWLAQHGVTQLHLWLEATGSYGDARANYMHAPGHHVSIVNPAAIKAFAASRLSRTKTDRVDAALIAQFCCAHQPPRWTPPAPALRELQALGRRLEALSEMRGMEDNRQAAGSPSPAIAASITAHLAYLNAERARVEPAIQRHITTHPTLQQHHP